jgi:hypothetical protein
MATHSFTQVIREEIDDIEVSLMFGPFPAPYTYLSDEMRRELVILRRLARRARRLSRQDSAHRAATTGGMIMTTLAQAIARHKAAEAAFDDAASRDDDAAITRLSEAESDAIEILAGMPCASDAEFLEKLRYLLARETRLFGEPDCNKEFGPIAVAVDRHFNVEP